MNVVESIFMFDRLEFLLSFAHIDYMDDAEE